MEDYFTEFQDLLRKLFQFDTADLDFGIYRLLKLKRDEVEVFLSEQLPHEVDEAYASITKEEKEALQREVERLAERAKEEIEPNAITLTGEVKPEYHESNIRVVRELVEEYEAKRQRLETAQAGEAQKAEVFNHLYNFFSRYYEEGDFIPLRRYGARETYAVPYQGQEIFLHWANNDQHYVKTAEYFKDYAFNVDTVSGQYRMRFTLMEASVPRDNTKGDRRYFFPRPDCATFDESEQLFILPFEYRLPTGEEIEKYGKNNKGQEQILEESLDAISNIVPVETLRVILMRDQRNEKERADGKPELPLLLTRLRHFTRRQTSDYFVHKNLRGFLHHELGFYIKDHILHLEDIEGDIESRQRMIRVLRRLGEQIIEFLAQVEETQKRLFEKKKFVLQTDYLLPIKHVPTKLWPEVLGNEAQRTEWQHWFALEPEKNLFNAKGIVNEEFLVTHPTLVVNTQHFDRDFVLSLLEALPFEDLEEAMDGLLIQGENYQALQLLEERYREQVECIYIDPPYNTGEDEFPYKDRYQHSSWLCALEERLQLGHILLSEGGACFISIGNEECSNLRQLMDAKWGADCFKSAIVRRRGIKSVQAQFDTIDRLNQGYDYVLMYSKNPTAQFKKLMVPKVLSDEEEEETVVTGGWNKHWRGTDRPTMRYPLFGETPETGQWRWAPERSEKAIRNYQQLLSELATENPTQEAIDEWVRGKEEQRGEKVDLLRLPSSGKPEHYVPPSGKKLASDLWVDVKVNGSHQLIALFGEKVFDNPKPVDLVKRICDFLCDPEGTILDFYAGSGTTADATISFNRKSENDARFILVEMGSYFDTVMLPRVAKVIYSSEWSKGQPGRLPTDEELERTPRLVKILRLESYDDALHNIVAESVYEQSHPRDNAYKEVVGEDEYRLRYLVKLPLDSSDTMLNLAKLNYPFDYTIEVLTEDGTHQRGVDLIETFNYLYGLRVNSIERWVNPDDIRGKDASGRQYQVIKTTNRDQDKRIMVIWRDMSDFDPGLERSFLEARLGEQGQAYDQVLINGDTAVPGVESLDPMFKMLMEQKEGR